MIRPVPREPYLPPVDDHRFKLQLLDTLREHAAALTATYNQQLWQIVTITATYSAGLNDHIILVNPAAATTVTLPAASDMINKRVVVKRIVASTANGITIQSSSGNLDGAASTTLNSAYLAKEFVSDGSNWWTV